MRSTHPLRTMVLGASLALLAAALLPGIAGAHIRDGVYTIRTKDIGVASGSAVGGKVKCPTGQRVVSGGAYWHLDGAGPTAQGVGILRASTPLPDATGWWAAGYNSGPVRVFTIVATCLPLRAIGPYTIAKRDFAAPVGGIKGGWVACPSGARAVSGGAYWHRAGKGRDATLDGFLASTGTGDLRSWYATSRTIELNVLLRVTVLCLPLAKVGTPTLVYQDLDTNGQDVGNYLACPAGKRLVAGGAMFHPAGERAVPTQTTVLHDSTPTTDGLGWWASGYPVPANMQLRLVVWCTTPR